MKILPFTIPKPQNDALLFQEDQQPTFYEYLHRHEEIQISYIKEGKGSIVVGDTVSRYERGDIIVLGSNLPHVFKSNKNLESHMLSIFFTETSFGNTFFETEELKSFHSFFRKANSGFQIKTPSEFTISTFQKFSKKSKLDRFISFVQLLKELNEAPSSAISSFTSIKKYSELEGRRMSSIFEYTMNHYREKITLDDIAKVAAMTPNAFCKYFKKRTRKTYITFLNELRIEESCKLLLQNPELSIAEIAEQSGFQNLSNFNRKFKALQIVSPLQFKQGHKA